jgi:flagellar motor switch protein FliG
MTSYDEFSPESTEVSTALTPSEKAAAVLLAMGKPVAGKLLKFFEHEELQEIIQKAQNLRTIKPQELSNWSTNSRICSAKAPA